MSKLTYFGVRLPVKLKEDVQNLVDKGPYMSPSEFARAALREKVDREKEN